MKIVCVANVIEGQSYSYEGGTFSIPFQEFPLEIDKAYDSLGERAVDGAYLVVMGDSSEFYPRELFMTVSEWREWRISGLLE